MTLIKIILDKMSLPHHFKMADVRIHIGTACNNYWKCAAVSYLSIINTKTGIKVTQKKETTCLHYELKGERKKNGRRLSAVRCLVDFAARVELPASIFKVKNNREVKNVIITYDTSSNAEKSPAFSVGIEKTPIPDTHSNSPYF